MSGTVTARRAEPVRRRAYSPEAVLLALGAGAAFVALWPLVLALAGSPPLDAWVLTAHVCGMLAGYGVVAMIGLMSRSPALERGVGADRLARWHRLAGKAVLTLVLVHGYAAVAAWAGSRGETMPLALWHVLGLPGLVAASLGTLMLVVVATVSVRVARRRVSYERWHAIHLLVYLAVGLSFAHQLAGPDLAGHRVVQVGWALLYTQVYVAVLRHRVIAPLRNAARHRMRVAAVVAEGAGVVSVVVEGRDLHELDASSGQFFRWRFLTPDLWWTAHPFSLSSSPTSHRLRLTVKTLGDGSSRLQALEPGTWIVAEGPYGAITSERRTRRDVLLIAGGVGITPMRALFESMPRAHGQDLLLLYRVRRIEDALFRAELDAIAAARGARVVYLTSDAAEPFSAASLARLVPNLTERDVYLCGPPGMAGAVRQACRASGLPARHLHEERFE